MTPTAAPVTAPPAGEPGGCAARHHGTASAYTKHRCRCPAARDNKRTTEKLRTAGLHPDPFVDPIGTVRRLRALTHLGHSPAAVRVALGWSYELWANTRAGCRPGRIRREKAEHVARVYEHLIRLPGADIGEQALAARKGWAPPQAWDGVVFAIDDSTALDDLAVATLGHPPALRRLIVSEHLAARTRAEQRAAAARQSLARNRELRYAASVNLPGGGR